MLDVLALKDLLGKTDPVYRALRYGGEVDADHGFSESRACRLIGVNWSAWQYEPLRRRDDALRERMRKIANEHRRFTILLRGEGKGMNLKKAYRLIAKCG